MAITTLSSHEFRRAARAAQRAAKNGPVVITDRGRPTHVLITFAAYRKLGSKRRDIAELLAMPGIEDVELPLSEAEDVAQAADLG